MLETANETEEVNIFDAEEPTYKKLEYAIFFNQKLDVKTVSDLYATVMISLFELNPEAFFTEEVERKLTLTKHAKDCREVIELNDTYFIEKHMSSKDKFDRLKVLLNAMDLEDELLIKYSAE